MLKSIVTAIVFTALALGAVTSSYAQEVGRRGFIGGSNTQFDNSYNAFAPRESDSGYAGPSAGW
jgi:hypothetical protein